MLANSEEIKQQGREVMSEKRKEAWDRQKQGLSTIDKPTTDPHDTRQIIADAVNVGTGIITNQLGRRNLPEAWRIDLMFANSEEIKQQGAEKRKQTEGRPSKEKLLSTIDNSLPKHDTRQIIADAANVATGTVTRSAPFTGMRPYCPLSCFHRMVHIKLPHDQTRGLWGIFFDKLTVLIQ
jgi:hypothetical protein